MFHVLLLCMSEGLGGPPAQPVHPIEGITVEFSPELLISAMDSEARYQAARAELTAAAKARQVDLYALWRERKDPRLVAAHMPRTVTAATVRAAVLALAPSQDFEQGELFAVETAAPGSPNTPVQLAA